MDGSAGVNVYTHDGIVERAGRVHDERPGSCKTVVEKGYIVAVAPELQTSTLGRDNVRAATQGAHEIEASRFEPPLREDPLVLLRDGHHDDH